MTEGLPKKILFVDDEPDVELLMKQRFRKEVKDKQFALFFAQNGVQALEILAKEPNIQLVVSDINMPEMDGLTLLNEINQKYPNVMAIVVSAYGDMKNIRSAMNSGAFDFVTKPINFDDLMITISKTLHHVQSLLDLEQTKKHLSGVLYDLSIATQIQESILPKVFINTPTIQLYAKMRPAKEIGGDLYDFFWIDPEETKLAFVVADVSGKGVPAALFMTVVRTLIRANTSAKHSSSDTIVRTNRSLEQDNSSMMFVTTFYGVLDITTGNMEYVNAGHNPPYIIRSGGKVEVIPATKDMALGIIKSTSYNIQNVQLEPNDMFYLFSDGVTEATNTELALYGDPQLMITLDKYRDLTPEELINTMLSELTTFANGYPQSDDITMLSVRYHGKLQP